jgi:hypothetical protein
MHIYCVNLEKRIDRKESAGREFTREGLSVEFFPATDGRINTPPGLDVNPAEYGCSMSHTRIWRDIVDKGHEVSLIFEDDVRLVSNFDSKLKLILEEVKDLEWDIIHLGPLIPIIKRQITPSVYEGQPLGTHAYLVSLECAKRIASFDPALFKVSVDFQLNRFPLRILCVNTSLAKQESIEDEPLIGLMRSAVGGDIGLQRTFDLNYLIRWIIQRFRVILAFVIPLLVLYTVNRLEIKV